jgi:DnaJ family protein C protein 7
MQTLLSKVNDNEKYNKLYKILKDIQRQKEEANQLFKQGKYNEAIEYYTRILELDPNNKNLNSTILSNRALCYVKTGKHMEALKDSNKAISLNDKYWKAYLRRGSAYLALNMPEEAKNDFQKVKENEPSNKEINKLLEDAKKAEKKARKRDYYKILQIDKNATENDIRKAYKKLALKWHPDRHNESEESKKMAEKTFRDISDAYVVLSDAQKKQQYDMGIDPLNPDEAAGGEREEGFGGQGFGGQGFGGQGFGGQGFGGQGFGGQGSRVQYSGNIDPNELFKVFFGGDDGGNRY